MSDTTPTPGKPSPAKSPAGTPEGEATPAVPGGTGAPGGPGGPGAPPKLPGARGAEKAADFRVIRSAAAAEPAGASMAPLIIGLVLVVGLAVGGYLYSQRGGGATPSGNGGGTTKTNDPKNTTEPAAPTDPMPDFVRDRIEFLKNEGNFEGALAYAVEKQADYPDAPDLKEEIGELRERTGVPAPLPPAEAIASAARRLEAKQYEEALEELDGIDDEGLTDAQKAKAKFLVALANAGLGNKLDALNALEEAEALGHPAAEIDPLRDQLNKAE